MIQRQGSSAVRGQVLQHGLGTLLLHLPTHVINVHANSGEKVLSRPPRPGGSGGQVREGVLRLAVQLDELQERGAELGRRRQPERPRPHEVLPVCAE